MAMKAASEIIDEEIGGDLVNAYASTLEEECGQKIVIEADACLKNGAKIELCRKPRTILPPYHIQSGVPGGSSSYHA